MGILYAKDLFPEPVRIDDLARKGFLVFDDDIKKRFGALINSVCRTEGSDAAAKGVQSGDILTAVNGETVTTTYEVNAIKERYAVGDTLTLTLYRDGKTFDVEVTLVDTNDIY